MHRFTSELSIFADRICPQICVCLLTEQCHTIANLHIPVQCKHLVSLKWGSGQECPLSYWWPFTCGTREFSMEGESLLPWIKPPHSQCWTRKLGPSYKVLFSSEILIWLYIGLRFSLSCNRKNCLKICQVFTPMMFFFLCFYGAKFSKCLFGVLSLIFVLILTGQQTRRQAERYKATYSRSQRWLWAQQNWAQNPSWYHFSHWLLSQGF